jgi:hypothetical protein
VVVSVAAPVVVVSVVVVTDEDVVSLVSVFLSDVPSVEGSDVDDPSDDVVPVLASVEDSPEVLDVTPVDPSSAFTLIPDIPNADEKVIIPASTIDKALFLIV